MGAMVSQITSLTIVYSAVHSYPDQRKHQSSASLAFVRGIHRRPLKSPRKWPVPQKMFPFDDVIMKDAHYKDEAVFRPSNIYNGYRFTGKTASIYWNVPPWVRCSPEQNGRHFADDILKYILMKKSEPLPELNMTHFTDVNIYHQQPGPFSL